MSWDEERKLYADKLERIIASIEKIQGIGNNRIVTSEMSSSLRHCPVCQDCIAHCR